MKIIKNNYYSLKIDDVNFKDRLFQISFIIVNIIIQVPLHHPSTFRNVENIINVIKINKAYF
jgi:hypothetical protein